MARGKVKEKAGIIARQSEALELRKRGKSYREIGEKLGISHQQAYRDVTSELQALAAMNTQSADELRQLELARLDKALNAVLHFVESGSPQHVMAMCKILDMRAKLLGLYAPVKQDIKLEDVSQMSDDERISRITSILESARARGTGRADPGVLQ